MSPVEAVAQIRALCDRADLQWAGHVGALRTTIPVNQVRAVLDAVSVDATPAQGAHLDPKRAAEVLDWCKREGGLDLYGWGDLISRLQECIVPSPPDAQSKVSDAYRRGYEDARTRFGASS